MSFPAHKLMEAEDRSAAARREDLDAFTLLKCFAFQFLSGCGEERTKLI